MGDPRIYMFQLDPRARPPLVRPSERIVPDIAWFNANRASVRGCHPVDGIEGIVIHATAGATAEGALAWWRQGGGAAGSAHWIVPAERDAAHGDHVIAAVYERLAAWHVRNSCSHAAINAGRASINHWSLGIEIVNTQSASLPDLFSDWQLSATVAIVRYCWAKYPNLKWVFSHAAVDPGRRSDPGANFPWDRFETLVKSGRERPLSCGRIDQLP